MILRFPMRGGGRICLGMWGLGLLFGVVRRVIGWKCDLIDEYGLFEGFWSTVRHFY